MGFEIGKRVADYEVVELLGTSKTGVAYKVRNVFAQRFEVLKILPKSIRDDEEQNARFLREIKVHAQLLHPNIVTFYNAREIEGQLVMTKEFVPGVTVAQKLQAGPVAWQDVRRYACQALSALEYAHSHSIIHRGLSSSRLIVTPEGIVRLNGFGLAKSVSDPELTAAGAVIGALKYMSPEQVKGDAVDARCDIYSLGIVLYEMLTGKLPFDATSQFDIMLAHVNTAPKHVTDVNPEVPRQLGDVIAKALAKDPYNRFQNAREFRGAVEHIELAREAAAGQTKPASVESPAPAAEPAFSCETKASVPPAMPDAWVIESALDLAESKLAGMELKPPPVALADSPAVVSRPESTPSSPIATEPLTGAPAVLASTPVAWWPLESTRPSIESEHVSTVLESVQPAVATPTFDEALHAPVPEPVASVEPPPVEIVSEPPALPQTTLPDWWTLDSQLKSAESKAWDEEFALSPPELGPATPIETTPAIVDSVPTPPTEQADLWTADRLPAVVESKPESTQLELLSVALEPLAAPVESHSVAARPALPPLTSYPDLWAADPSPASVESQSETAPLVCATSITEPAAVSTGHAEPEEQPLSLWISGPPDTWASEPPIPKPEAIEQPSLSAAIEPPTPQVEADTLLESSSVSPAMLQEVPVIESETAVSELAPESAPAFAAESVPPAGEPTPATAPVSQAETAAIVNPPPAVTQRPTVNPDLLTALFGDSLLSRVSLTLVICAVTFLLGTVTLFAVLSVTKP